MSAWFLAGLLTGATLTAATVVAYLALHRAAARRDRRHAADDEAVRSAVLDRDLGDLLRESSD